MLKNTTTIVAITTLELKKNQRFFVIPYGFETIQITFS